MGKGDIKTRRGKISNKSYGKHRMHKASSGYVEPAKVEKVEEEVSEPKKPATKKRVAKKTTTAKAKTTAKKAEAK